MDLKKELSKIKNRYNSATFGDCIPATNETAEALLDNNIKSFTVYEGFVEVKDRWTGKNESGNHKIIEHTWLKLNGGKIIDFTTSQFKKYGGIHRYLDETNTSKYSGEFPKTWNATEYKKLLDREKQPLKVRSGVS